MAACNDIIYCKLSLASGFGSRLLQPVASQALQVATTAPGSGEPLLLPLPPPSLPLSLSLLHLPPTPILSPHAPHTTGQLQIYQARITSDLRTTEVWRVEGVATVAIGGNNPPRYVFDCNTTLNNGSGIRWTRLDRSHLGLPVRSLTNGERLDAGVLMYQNLGNYSCLDHRTGERLTLMITDSKNTDRKLN